MLGHETNKVLCCVFVFVFNADVSTSSQDGVIQVGGGPQWGLIWCVMFKGTSK